MLRVGTMPQEKAGRRRGRPCGNQLWQPWRRGCSCSAAPTRWPVPGRTAWPYNRGDYLPAIRLFRPLAEQGNPKAQTQIGTMYRKGEGTTVSLARAFMWFSVAAKRGDAKAKAGLRDVSKTMTPAEMSQAKAMADACAASNYRACEY